MPNDWQRRKDAERGHWSSRIVLAACRCPRLWTLTSSASAPLSPRVHDRCRGAGRAATSSPVNDCTFRYAGEPTPTGW